MAKPKFVSGANTLQFSRGLQYPLERPMEKVQGMDRTAAGRLEVESLGPVINTRRLVFKDLPPDDYTALRNWFDNIADGGANTFTYFDEVGDSMTVRIITPRVNFPANRYQRYSGELELEVSS